MNFEFRPLRREELPLLFEWLHRSHVAEWWDSSQTCDELEADYFPAVASSDDGHPFLAWLDDRPRAFIQWYEAGDGVIGIDQFLADADDLGTGLGTKLVSEFAAVLFRDARVTRIVVDPVPSNARAIRCYEKAGFRALGEITTADGPALMMALDRAAE